MKVFTIALQAVALAALPLCVIGNAVAAWFSVNGMVLLFPAAGSPIVVMAIAMEFAKLIVAGWLVSRWRETFWLWRLALAGFVLGLVSISAVALYSHFVIAYAGRHAEITAAIEVTPIQYIAQLFGIRAGGEQVIYQLIVAMVMCCAPLAVVLVVAVGARSGRAA
jgi:hypothetical protein